MAIVLTCPEPIAIPIDPVITYPANALWLMYLTSKKKINFTIGNYGDVAFGFDSFFEQRFMTWIQQLKFKADYTKKTDDYTFDQLPTLKKVKIKLII